jgi:hypothetical protein
MNSLLNKMKKINRKGGEEKMKKILVLTLGIFFLLGGLSLFADVTTTVSSSTRIERVYSPAGVLVSSTVISTETTRTNGDNGVTDTVSVNTSYYKWLGGSSKLISSSGTSDSTSSDGGNSHTNSWTNYNYDGNGVLVGANGGSDTSGVRGGNQGTFTATATDSYQIVDGQALRTRSDTVERTFLGGQETSHTEGSFTEFHYQLLGGDWQLTSTFEHSNTRQSNDTFEITETTTTYFRDGGTGRCIGMERTMTGNNKTITTTGGEQYGNLQYSHDPAQFDSREGWYIPRETLIWLY